MLSCSVGRSWLVACLMCFENSVTMKTILSASWRQWPECLKTEVDLFVPWLFFSLGCRATSCCTIVCSCDSPLGYTHVSKGSCSLCVCLVVIQSPQCELNSWSRSLISPCSYTRVGPTSQQLFPDIWSPLLSDISPIRTIRYVWKSFLFNENSSCKCKLFLFFNLMFKSYKYEKNKRIKAASFTETADLMFAFSFRCGRPAKQRCSSFWSRASSPKPIWRPKYVQFCSSWPNPAVMMTTK